MTQCLAYLPVADVIQCNKFCLGPKHIRKKIKVQVHYLQKIWSHIYVCYDDIDTAQQIKINPFILGFFSGHRRFAVFVCIFVCWLVAAASDISKSHSLSSTWPGVTDLPCSRLILSEKSVSL